MASLTVASSQQSVGEPGDGEQLVRGLVDGLWGVLERDPGLQRVYFDLAAQSIVEPEVQEIMRAVKAGHREVLIELLEQLPGRPARGRAEGIAVFVIAGLEGLALERLDRGETPARSRARKLFVTAVSAAVASA